MTTERNAFREARNRLMSLGIGLLFMGHVFPLCAADYASVRTHEGNSALPVSLTTLERELLEDVRDGRLDRFDLIEAGLIASGATDPVLLSRYKRRFSHLQQHALLSIPYLMHTEQMAAELFHYLHRYVLRQFDTRPVTVINLLSDGRYNCITASWLYIALAQRYDLPATVIKTPMHAYVRLETRPPIPIEMTVPVGGVDHAQTREQVIQTLLDAGLVDPSQIESHGADDLFLEYQRHQFPLEPVQILSVLFYNSALHAFERGDPHLAFRNALGAQLSHPEDRQYQQLTFDMGLAYATFLRQRGDHDGESGIVTYLRGMKQLFASNVPVGF